MSRSAVYDISFTTKEYTLELREPIILKRLFESNPFKLGVIKFNTYYSIYNINELNNNFRYYNGNAWVDDRLIPGMYNVSDINSKLNIIINDNENLEIIHLILIYKSMKPPTNPK